MTKSDISIERGGRLQELRKKTGLSRTAFAELTGMNAHTLKSLELGDREMTPQKALLFSNLFSGLLLPSLGEEAHKASFDFLYHGKETEAPEKEKLTHDYEDRLQNDVNGFTANPAYSVLKIQDDLMSPFYNEGDVVAGRKIVNKNQFSLYQGHICILEASSGEKFLRRIIKAESKKITSCLLNANASQGVNVVEEIEARSIAQAIWHWHLSELIRPSSSQ